MFDRDDGAAQITLSARSVLLDRSCKTVIMTPMMHLLLLPLLLSISGGNGVEEKKGPLENKVLDVPEGTSVPYLIYQFQSSHPHVSSFKLSGEGSDVIMISDDGWLYLKKPLDWSQNTHYVIEVEALAEEQVVEGPVTVTVNVLDINNHAPFFNQTVYSAVVRERSRAGVPFIRVFASDRDDPESPNALLSYSLVSQIPMKQNTFLFQINAVTGEISITQEGEQTLKAREDIEYIKGEGHSEDALQKKFDEYCSPQQQIPYKLNPFYLCVEKAVAEMNWRNVNPFEDPDYTLIVRVQDLGGASGSALSGSARVNVFMQKNLWVNPGLIRIKEHTVFPEPIAKVQSNDPDAIYRLVQKERVLKFPFSITVGGEIYLTEELDREEKDQYIVVVLAEDKDGKEVDPPMEIQVVVEDVNDNSPQCGNVSVFELQESEPIGSVVGTLQATDDDEPGTVNSMLIYTILSQDPPTTPDHAFSIDAVSGQIQVLRVLERKDFTVYHLNVNVKDPDHSQECEVVIKIIDVNNELPMFEKSDYGSHDLAEDTPVGHTVLTVRATDADDPGSGSSQIEFHISAGNDDGAFTVETDGSGVGHVVVAQPLDFESSPSYNLKIDARNLEPLMRGLEYGSDSSTSVSVSVTDVDEDPEFSLEILDVTVHENVSVGAVLLTVEAKDPEGKELSFKLDGDSRGWLEIDDATGQIKTKEKLDREILETFEVTVTAFEKDNPGKSAERVVSVNLLDVNDNYPKLKNSQAFICVMKPEPVIIQAYDEDASPFSQPFTFTLAHTKKSPNWDLQPVDDITARLTLKKFPTQDQTFMLPINVKDTAGMGITHKLEVRVCNCTELGHCYIEPGTHSHKYGLGTTIGILAGTLGFVVILFIIVVQRLKKKDTEPAGPL